MASFKIETSQTELDVVVGRPVEILFSVTNLADEATDGMMTVEWVDGSGRPEWAAVVSGSNVRFSPGGQRDITVRIEVPAGTSDEEIAKARELALVVTGGIDQEQPDRSYPIPVQVSKPDPGRWSTPVIIGIGVAAAVVVIGLGIGIYYWLSDPGGALFAPCADASDCQKRYECSEQQCLTPLEGRCKDDKECVYPFRCDGRCRALKNPEKVTLGVGDTDRVVVVSEAGAVVVQKRTACSITAENRCVWVKQFDPVTKRFLLLQANKYLGTDGDGNVVADRDARNPNVLWLIEPVEGEERKFSFKAPDGRFLTVRGTTVRANASKAGDREEFTMPPDEN